LSHQSNRTISAVVSVLHPLDAVNECSACIGQHFNESTDLFGIEDVEISNAFVADTHKDLHLDRAVISALSKEFNQTKKYENFCSTRQLRGNWSLDRCEYQEKKL
jgi:hypothetical protein